MFFIHARRPWGSNNQKTCQKSVMPPVLYGISPLIYIYIYIRRYMCVIVYLWLIYGLSMAYLWDYRPLHTKWVARIVGFHLHGLTSELLRESCHLMLLFSPCFTVEMGFIPCDTHVIPMLNDHFNGENQSWDFGDFWGMLFSHKPKWSQMYNFPS